MGNSDTTAHWPPCRNVFLLLVQLRGEVSSLVLPHYDTLLHTKAMYGSPAPAGKRSGLGVNGSPGTRAHKIIQGKREEAAPSTHSSPISPWRGFHPDLGQPKPEPSRDLRTRKGCQWHGRTGDSPSHPPPSAIILWHSSCMEVPLWGLWDSDRRP